MDLAARTGTTVQQPGGRGRTDRSQRGFAALRVSLKHGGRSWVWPAVVGVSGAATALAFALDFGGPIRVLLACWFLFVCPGLPYVQLLRLRSALVAWPLTMALSLALDTAVATILAYAGLWSTGRCLLALIVISYVGAGLLLRRD